MKTLVEPLFPLDHLIDKSQVQCTDEKIIITTDIKQLQTITSDQKFRQLMKKENIIIILKTDKDSEGELFDVSKPLGCVPEIDFPSMVMEKPNQPWYQRFNKKGKF